MSRSMRLSVCGLAVVLLPAIAGAATNCVDINCTNPVEIRAISNLPPLEVFFSSSSNRAYTLDYCTNLIVGFWTNVPGQVRRQGNGGVDWLDDTNGTPGPLFYRLRVELQQ